ncbi:unnamed protein product, partial [Allacma fusca]
IKHQVGFHCELKQKKESGVC